MAKDVSGKPAVSSSNSGNTSPSIPDQQKVPPLRIVLNTSGNQKSPCTGIAVAANQQQELKKEKANEAKNDNLLKGTGGRVRIKLGTSKQNHKSVPGSESPSKTSSEETQKQKSISERKDISNKEDLLANYGTHLRRITRRSQKTAQTVSAEDEESISSMTSTDENQITSNSNNNNNSNDNNTTSETATATTSQSNCTSNASNVNGNNNSDTPRRYKRRKGETSESSISEQFNFFGFQNYKLPTQNSFELYKNIRKQVDKKLDNLSSIQLASPRGFRDYMLTRGTYLLEGNRLGNGTNLFMNEDGGLYSVPLSKYHAFRNHRVNYSVPNRAKVPLGLPINSPLYNLFIDQEKERYRMRIQHIKEREKLTLAAEQEILRVYNQAAMIAANQNEPFSVCTMLKHQEIYNYMDADGSLVLASGDIQHDELKQDEIKQDEERNRRKSVEQVSPSPVRKNSSTEDCQMQLETQKDSGKTSSSKEEISQSDIEIDKSSCKDESDALRIEEDSPDTLNNTSTKLCKTTTDKSKPSSSVEQKAAATNELDTSSNSSKTKTAKIVKTENTGEQEKVAGANKKDESKEVREENSTEKLSLEVQNKIEVNKKSIVTDVENSRVVVNKSKDFDKEQSEENSATVEEQGQEKTDEHKGTQNSHLANEEVSGNGEGCSTQVAGAEQAEENAIRLSNGCGENILSDDERQANDKELFLSQLKDIDDKWDKIRGEMLIRHRNEAESLHAVQKLEWEWKTKEIGACDVRVTPIIDSVLVPKLSIYSQDY